MLTIKQKFAELKKQNKKAFIAYVPFGFPGIAQTKNIILALQEAGVDIIELGIPFSDPIADGPIIQEATTIALEKGANIQKLFSTLKEIKKNVHIPMALMTYYNPVLRFGIKNFFREMRLVGVSAIITVDLPSDENKDYIELARRFNVETIFLVAPTTTDERARTIIRATRGFVYYVSVTGITGPRALELTGLEAHVKKLKKTTRLPVCVGFGIHSREQIKRIGRFCDGVIVGSSIVKFIKDNCRERGFASSLKAYVRSLRGQY
jgi:tryptophan synthase alpha chain